MASLNKIKETLVKTVLPNVGAYIALVAVLLLGLSIWLDVFTEHGKEFPVPDFTMISMDDATELASRCGVRLEVVDSVYVHGLEKGYVYRQNPTAGSLVKSGRRVLLTTNAVAPKRISMPNVVGYSLRQARSELLARGLRLKEFRYVRDMATNNVLQQLYNGEEIVPGTIINTDSEITLVCGLNPSENKTFVPDLTGLSASAAVSMMCDNSLNAGTISYDSDIRTLRDSLAARVYAQYPKAEIVSYTRIDSTRVDTVRTSIQALMGSRVSIYLGLPKVEELPQESSDTAQTR